MKKLFTILALAGISVALANPIPKIGAEKNQCATPKVAPSSSIESFYSNPIPNVIDKGNSLQATSYKTVVPFVFNAPNTYYNSGTQFQYDPGAKVLSIYHTDYKVSGSNIVGTIISVYTSTNSGLSWVKNALYDKTGPFTIYGSFAAVNATKSTDFAQWNLLGSGVNLDFNSGINYYSDMGQIFQIKTGADVQDAKFEGPSTNNPSNYHYPLNTEMMPIIKDGVSYVMGVGQSFRPSKLTAPEDLLKYSFFAFNFDGGEFTASTFPASLATTNFSSPSPQTTADNYLSVPNIGYDEEGTIYYGVTNYLSQDNTIRVPAVSKSSDMGKTWSNINDIAMPATLMTDYTKAKYAPNGTDATTTFISGPYDQNGFTVYGKNKFSYLIRLYSENTTAATSYLDLVECLYDNGVWSLKTIGELSSYPRILETILSTTSEFKGRTKYSANGQGAEVQLSKTADGKTLVAKWIDEDSTQGVDGDFTLVANNNQNTEQLFSIKRLNTTDVYLSYRDINGGTWSTPLNATKDLAFQKATKIPAIVPSIDKIPLIYLEFGTTNSPNLRTQDSAISKAPSWVRGMLADDGYAHDQKLQYATLSAGIGSVKDDAPVSNQVFQLNPVFPNPVSGIAELSFVMNKPGFAKLTLLNQVGQVVKVMYDGMLAEGAKYVTVNTEDLSTGVYYYNLSVGDNSATKVLNVVK